MEGPGPEAEATTDRAFRLLLALAAAIGPAFAAWLGRVEPVLPSVVLSLLVLALSIPVLRERGGPRLRIVLVVLLALGVPVHYLGVGRTIEALALAPQDGALLDADDALLGWLFPSGQISVWIDRSDVFGPHTLLGRVLTEVFQLSYFSYYAWGFGLLVLLAVRYLKAPSARMWTHVCVFLCAWLGAFLVNFVLYAIVPAWGPWLAFPELYAHPLEGLALTQPIRALIAENQTTPDCFPSGHTALSWIAAICALRLAPRYGRYALAGAVLITLATVGLRYHYVVDLVAAVPLVLLGLLWGGFLRRGDTFSARAP